MKKASPKKNVKKAKQKDIDSNLEKLGSRIRELRIERGYTSAEHFAYDHDISRAQYARYEKGEDLRFSSLYKVVTAFGLTLEEFFEDFE